MPDDEARPTINPASDDVPRSGISGISTVLAPGQQQAIATEWLQHAIYGIKETHSNEDARREIAQRLF